MNAPINIPAEVLTEAEAAEKQLEAARSYPVPTTGEEYSGAANELKSIKARLNTLEGWREKLKRPILEAGRAVDDFFKTPKQHLVEAEKAIKAAMLTYDRQQEEIRREAERKAAEAQRKEQERLRAEAEKAERIAREKREKEEAAARAKREKEEAKARKLAEKGQAEEAERRRQAAAEAEQRRLQEAEEREAQRLRDAEAARLAAETMPTAPVVHIEKTKVAGISTRKIWSSELYDLDALIAAAHGGDSTARNLLTYNQSVGDKLAGALKDGMSVPGVRAVCREVMSSRAS